ncbi:MAG: glycosyltransferase [Verrucomicrobiota bacterium]
MNLVIVHYHLRPGGIRRVIELATPHLLRELRDVTTVTLACGEAGDEKWLRQFAELISPARLQVHVEKAFNYFSEQKIAPQKIRQRLRLALEKLFTGSEHAKHLVWAHNLAIGRNLLLSQELARTCAARGITLVSHHHDLWFDNRWRRWPEIRCSGFRNLTDVANTTFPAHPDLRHAGINSEDASVFQKYFGPVAALLPNPVPRQRPPRPAAVRAAHQWLERTLREHDAPVWILPCRLLRRKNVAEALLLTHWLRPEAWLITTGSASSADELPYFQKLERTAHQHHYRLRLGVLQGDETSRPSVAELMAASETVLLTSLQEGFGLPYLEAAAARRPLIARNLPNVAPDLRRFGFRLPQTYDEIRIATDLFDWKAERARQQKMFTRWRQQLPTTLRKSVATPIVLESTEPASVPFSRLTLTAQLEVLAQPRALSWERCAPLNPFLHDWQKRAATGKLRVTPWPATADNWLSGATYAKTFVRLVQATPRPTPAQTPLHIQTELVGEKLCAANLYPLLWAAAS